MTPLQDTATFLKTFSPWRNGLRGRCPRCQQASMFRAPLRLRPQCPVCGLDYSFASPADGPATIAMPLVSTPAVIWGMVLELKYNAPLWVHLVTTLPFILLACISTLHLLRGFFVSAEYYIKIRDGRMTHHEVVE